MKETEKTVLGSAITNKAKLEQIIDEDGLFTNDDHADIFDAMRELHGRGEDIDVSVLLSELKGTHEDVVADIIQSEVTINFNYHLDKLKKERHRLKIWNASERLYKSVEAGAVDIDDFVNEIQRLGESYKSNGDEFATGEEMSAMALDDLFKKEAFFKTGIHDLDDKLMGVFNYQLFVVAGRPATGKTTLALNFMKNMEGTPLLFSLEMPRTQIYAKLLSGDSSVDDKHIRTHLYLEGERDRVADAHLLAKEKYKKWLIYDKVFTISKIANTVRRRARTQKIQAVVIDYLQLIKGGKGETENIQLSDITRELKLLTLETGVPIILLSQLNRANQRENRRPALADLRGSGAIEQDADVVIFTHHQIWEDGGESDEILIRKNRIGALGDCTEFKFVKEYSRFENPTVADFDEIKSGLQPKSMDYTQD